MRLTDTPGPGSGKGLVGGRTCRREDPRPPHPTVSVQECKIKTNGTLWGGGGPAKPGHPPPSIQVPPEHSLPPSFPITQS